MTSIAKLVAFLVVVSTSMILFIAGLNPQSASTISSIAFAITLPARNVTTANRASSPSPSPRVARPNASRPTSSPRVTTRIPQAANHTQPSVRPARAFIVVFMGHSGSTAFTTELQAHPHVDVRFLEPLDHGPIEFDTDLALARARRILDHSITNDKMPGFKIRPFHLRNRPDAWRLLVREYDMRVFWQFRVNIFKQAVGEYRHRVLNDTSVVEGLRGDDRLQCDDPGQKDAYACQFAVRDVPALHALLNDFSINDELLSEAVRFLNLAPHQLMPVKYEDYLYRRERTVATALRFLGLSVVKTVPLRHKASPDNLCNMVSNFQHVCTLFYACQLWRPYLDDARNSCYCNATMDEHFDPALCRRNAWHQERVL